MTASATEISEELRAAAADRARTQELLAARFAEVVELRHDPAAPGDGPFSGRLLAEISRREIAAATRSLPDATNESEITVDGDRIRVVGRTSGTLGDGKVVDVRTDTTFTVADGAIVALASDMDPESMAAWGQVLAAGGFELPAELLDALS
jgi:ketosteroid isomerase-like protein